MKRPELPDNQAEMLIIFIYYKNLQEGIAFYHDFLGFPLAIDQGFCKIYKLSTGGYIGVVDEAQGMHKTHPIKPVQICLRVPDVDTFYQYCKYHQVNGLSKIFINDKLKIKAFVFNDPEGYQLEIQEAII